MRNKLTALAVVAGLAAIPVASQAAEAKDGFFVNGSIGRSELNKGVYDDTDTGYIANLGYRWALAPNFALGVEGGYTDLGKWTGNLVILTDPPEGSPYIDSELKGWTLGANAHWNLTDNWYVSGRAGLFRANLKGEYLTIASGAVARASVDDTSNKWYGGVGVGYDFTRNFGVGISYDYYQARKDGPKFDPSLVSVTAEARF
jgi:outer membrane autotransporter protein